MVERVAGEMVAMIDAQPVTVDELCFPTERSWIPITPLLVEDETSVAIRTTIMRYLLVSCGNKCRVMGKQAYLLKHGIVTEHLRALRGLHGLSLYDPRRAYNSRTVRRPICRACAMTAHALLQVLVVYRDRLFERRRLVCHE